MRVEPKTEAEVQEANLLPIGVYDFEVRTAEDKLSQKGNEMAELTLHVQGAESAMTVKDFLVDIPSMAYKVRHFAESVGLLSHYEKGELPAEAMMGRTGRCKIGIEPQKGEYRAKNKVIDYLPPQNGNAAAPAPAAPDPDDDIPF